MSRFRMLSCGRPVNLPPHLSFLLSYSELQLGKTKLASGGRVEPALPFVAGPEPAVVGSKKYPPLPDTPDTIKDLNKQTNKHTS